MVESAVADYGDNGLATIESASQWELRQSSSIDQNGIKIDGLGKSYFPGYAIDVETGDRLNIFFGENSVYNSMNDSILHSIIPNIEVNTSIGGDMIWNPSTELLATGDINIPLGSLYDLFAGGQHYIYVTRQPYDGCKALYDKLEGGGLINKVDGVSFVTWTGIPIPQEPLLSLEEGLIPNDLTIKLRVTNAFNKEIIIPKLSDPKKKEAVGTLPVYKFAFGDVEATDIVEAKYENALDSVQVVPNPYYAYSSYEQGQHSNIVKITNLPPRAVVTIYTLDGKFIQQFKRDAMPRRNSGNNPALAESQIVPAIEWNLTNNKGIPIASGVYIFHISAPDLKLDKSIKWFGVNRRFDPTGL